MNWVSFAALGLVVSVSHFGVIDGVSFEQDVKLTRIEKESLDKFREKVLAILPHDYMKQDIYLIRWLRARNFNLKAAEEMLQGNLKWRVKNNMDNILEEDWDDMRKDFHVTGDTFDKDGRPIGTIDIGSWNIRSAVLQGKGERLLRFLDYSMEHQTQRVFEEQAKGKNVTQRKVLIDSDGFNLIQQGCTICLPLWLQYVQSLENHYTGWMDELIVFNSSPAISAILEVVRPFLTPSTRSTMRIFGTNKSQWEAYLDARVDKSERRPEYGGTRPQPDFW